MQLLSLLSLSVLLLVKILFPYVSCKYPVEESTRCYAKTNAKTKKMLEVDEAGEAITSLRIFSYLIILS